VIWRCRITAGRLICTGGLWKFGDGAHGAAADDQADAGVDDDDQGEEKAAPRDDHELAITASFVTITPCRSLELFPFVDPRPNTAGFQTSAGLSS